MKPILLFICIAFIFSCKKDSNNENNESPNNSEIASLQGAWELVSYYNYRENGEIDTISSSKDNHQIKIYSDSKVMWGRERSSDTLDWFGYGNYSIKNDSLIEVLDFGSKAMNNIIKNNREFVFKIVIGEDTFSQIQMDSLGTLIYAENYVRLE